MFSPFHDLFPDNSLIISFPPVLFKIFSPEYFRTALRLAFFRCIIISAHTERMNSHE